MWRSAGALLLGLRLTALAPCCNVLFVRSAARASPRSGALVIIVIIIARAAAASVATSRAAVLVVIIIA